MRKNNLGKSKYGSEWTVVDGIKFQSKKEANEYVILKGRLIAGEIKDFKRQVTYSLEVNGVLICKYIADFVVYNWDGTWEVKDVKSDFTKKLPIYRMKKALMEAIHGIKIKEC